MSTTLTDRILVAKGTEYNALIIPEGDHYRHLMSRATGSRVSRVSHEILPLFNSSTVNKKLLKRLFDLIVANGKWSGLTAYRTLPSVKSVDKAISKMDSFNDAELLAFVMVIRGYSQNYPENLKLAEKHVEFWKTYELNVQPDIYWHPEVTQYGLESARKLQKIERDYYTPVFINRCPDPEYLSFARRTYRLRNARLDNPKLKSVDEDGESYHNIHFLKLPFHHKEFRDYLLELTISEYKQILKEIPLRTPAKDAIAMADELLGRTQKVNPTVLALKTYGQILRASILDEKHSGDWVELQRLILKHSEESNLIQVVHDFAESFNEGTLDYKRRLRLMEVVVYRNKRTWVSTQKHANFIAGRLLELTGSGRETYEILEGFYNSRPGTTYKQWQKYFDNWDEYKTMPGEIAAVLL